MTPEDIKAKQLEAIAELESDLRKLEHLDPVSDVHMVEMRGMFKDELVSRRALVAAVVRSTSHVSVPSEGDARGDDYAAGWRDACRDIADAICEAMGDR